MTERAVALYEAVCRAPDRKPDGAVPHAAERLEPTIGQRTGLYE